MKKYLLGSCLSGCVWAGIAALICGSWVGRSGLVGGAVLAPFIGMGVGSLFVRAYRLPNVAQFFLSLFTLYVAAFLYGLAVGGFVTLTGDVSKAGMMFEHAFAVLWGLTFIGWFVLLWPLAYLNHRLLRNRLPGTPTIGNPSP